VARYSEPIPDEHFNEQPLNGSIQFARKLAKVAFFLFIFFAFFRTSIPFGEKIENIEDIASSNVFNQIVYTLIYILAITSLISKRRLVFKFIKTEKFLSLFLLWSLLSVFWSDYPMVSFKRWVQICGISLVPLSVLLHVRSADDLFVYFKIILIIYISLTLLSVLAVPGALDRDFPDAWRGIAPSKNLLGQVCLMSLLFWSYFASRGDHRQRLLAIVFWSLSIILLIGAKSFTSLITGLFIVFLSGSIYLHRLVFRKLIGRVYSFIFISSFYVCLFALIYFGSDILDSILGHFGKDFTLTGRTELWSTIFRETQKHFFAGCGFGGFWVVESPFMSAYFEDNFWIPNQSHFGYLDILNETGVVGIFLFVLLVIFYFRNLLKLGEPHFWKWFVITVLILNITESSLFKTGWISFTLFNFAYIALYTKLIHKPSHQST